MNIFQENVLLVFKIGILAQCIFYASNVQSIRIKSFYYKLYFSFVDLVTVCSRHHGFMGIPHCLILILGPYRQNHIYKCVLEFILKKEIIELLKVLLLIFCKSSIQPKNAGI